MQQDAASKMAHNIAHTAVMQMTINLLISMFPPEQEAAIRGKLVDGIEEIIDEHLQIDLLPNEIKPAREQAKLLVRAMIIGQSIN
jgi:Tfp pilus assembly pilus retraction ATPase PilT